MKFSIKDLFSKCDQIYSFEFWEISKNNFFTEHFLGWSLLPQNTAQK